MRFFLYTYKMSANFQISRRAGVFGAPYDATGLPTKVRQLRRGDIIIIRDATHSELRFFGRCVVVGDVFDQEKYSPFRDHLWEDEIEQERVIYPLRVAVDFKTAPELSLDSVTWEDLDRLGFTNAKGQPLTGRQAWGKKLSGNFVSVENEVAPFSDLLGVGAA
ncbi:MAG: hypothetical protein ACREQ8_10280 [Woeseiaceae bacterium]